MSYQETIINTNIWTTPKNKWEKQPVIEFNPNDVNLINAIQNSLSEHELERLNIFKVKEEISQEILTMRLS